MKTIGRRTVRIGRLVVGAALTFALLAPCLVDRSRTAARADEAKPAKPASRYGVKVNDPKAFQGYTLVFPLTSKNTYLIDMQGRVVHKWESKYTAGQDAYLLENGNLLRSAKLADGEAFFAGAGAGGRIQEFTRDGKLVWDYKFHNEKQTQHHGITPMPNGNVMMIVWERKTAKEAIAAGVKPELAGRGEMLVDSLIEVKKTGKTTGKIVWKWHIWDHLIQDHDKTKANYGDVAKHPERIDVNFARRSGGGFAWLFGGAPKKDKDKPKDKEKPAKDKDKPKDKKKDGDLEKLKGIGYIGAGGGRRFAGFLPDWTHVNAVAYNPKLDQIMLCPREFNEVWIIDHSTTTAEAASSKGGKSGKGGDLLYRWGNPRAYRAGTARDQKLFVHHDAHWIPPGLPGEGNLLVFNNGTGRPGGAHSTVDEIVLPVDAKGRYELKPGAAWGPKEATWSYAAPKKSDFYAIFMSGAQRMPNGNTLISTGFTGSIFEVTPKKEEVWKFIAPLEPGVGRGGWGFLGGWSAGSPLFRAYRYGPKYKGLAGKELKPGKTLEELWAAKPPGKK
jgi:hypothetical protein